MARRLPCNGTHELERPDTVRHEAHIGKLLEKGKVTLCTKIRLWYARTAAMNSFSLLANRNSTQKEASPTSRSVARLAVMQSVAVLPDRNAKCSLLSAIPAAAKQECRSSPVKAVRSTAVHAMQR